MPKNTKEAFKHAASLGHQQRLCDVKLATQTLLSNLYSNGITSTKFSFLFSVKECVKDYVLVTPKNDVISLDEDDTLPGNCPKFFTCDFTLVLEKMVFCFT
jgi:hypothetical protein